MPKSLMEHDELYKLSSSQRSLNKSNEMTIYILSLAKNRKKKLYWGSVKGDKV